MNEKDVTVVDQKKIIIHNIAIPFWHDAEILVQDLERPWKYYPSYIFHARLEKNVLSPAKYLMEIIRQAIDHDHRNRVSVDFARHLGDEFFKDLEKFDVLYKQFALAP